MKYHEMKENITLHLKVVCIQPINLAIYKDICKSIKEREF